VVLVNFKSIKKDLAVK